jgi:PAS domain S-box-containing protein
MRDAMVARTLKRRAKQHRQRRSAGQCSKGIQLSNSSTAKCEPVRCDSELCRDILASMADAVITTDEEGQVSYLNAVAASLTGWTQHDAVGVLLAKVINPIDLEMRGKIENRTRQAMHGGVIADVAGDLLAVSKDGTEYQIDSTAAPFRHADGRVAGIVWTFRDVTVCRRQEQMLADAATLSDSIIATLREPFLVLDTELRIKTANAAFYETFQTIAGETEGRMLYELNDGKWNVPQLRSALNDLLADNRAVRDFEVQEDFSGISRKDMLLNATPFGGVNGRPEMILLAIEDISTRKVAEAVVQASEERYRRLFQTAKDGILILDSQTLKVIDANPFMTELLGYSPNELIGKELWEIGFFADKRASQAAYRELKEQGYIRYDHLPLETKGGLRVEVEFVCNTYQVGARNVAQCNIRDIGDRSRLEKKTQEQAAALVDLHRRKDEFLAMLSHELRNPLAPIADAVQLLRLRPNDAPIQEKARIIIERQVAQLTRLIDDLMEVSRITTGKIRLHLEPIVVNAVVERAMESTQARMDHHKHEITFSPSPEPVLVQGDAARLEQVIVNLLANAAKYTPDGGRISVVVRQEGDECVLRVRDTGIGIAAELLPQIFDLFSQADRSLDRAQGGLGIGLALVQRLVEVQQGRVEAFSSLGQGSEFVVRIPVTSAPASPASAARDAAAPTPARQLRVLVVDDSEDAAECLSLRMEASGHQVKTASDGPTALETAGEFRPNIVFLDIGLPGMTGYDVAKQMRSDPLLHNVKLVALTGYGEASARQRSLEAGFDHHLVKPADFRKLNEILGAVSATAP